MSKKKPLTPYEEARRKVNRILAELDEILQGWTPKEDR